MIEFNIFGSFLILNAKQKQPEPVGSLFYKQNDIVETETQFWL